jgi:arylsulfatase
MQLSIYYRGLMVGETPNIDRIGNEARSMDYVAMQSCTSGKCLLHRHVSAAHRHDPGNRPAAVLSAARHPGAAKFLLDPLCTGEFGKIIWATASLPTAHGSEYSKAPSPRCHAAGELP